MYIYYVYDVQYCFCFYVLLFFSVIFVYYSEILVFVCSLSVVFKHF